MLFAFCLHAWGVDVDLGLGAQAAKAAIEVYEDVSEKPADAGLLQGQQVEAVRDVRRIIVQVHNKTDRTRSIGVRLRVRHRVEGAAGFWDGLKEHPNVSEPIWRRELVDTFPMACVFDGEGGVALGFDPDTMYSYLATSGSTKHLTYETRVVLRSGAKREIRFVAYAFAGRWGWRNALDKYYATFPQFFRPHSKVDPRVWKGLDAGPEAERYYYRHPHPDLFRRGRLTYGWCYAPFKRTGDFYCRPQFWDFEPLTPKKSGLAWGRSREDYHVLRRKYFDHGKPANVAQLFYVSNASEKGLADTQYPASVIKPPTRFGCLPATEVAYRVFSAGGKFGRQMHQDLTDICRENYVAGFAYDSSGGMGSRKYRGPTIWEMDHVAFDEAGPYVYEGVGIARNIHHMHQTPAIAGRYVAGCKINPGGEHPMPYMMNFAADNSMVEWVSLGSFKDGDDTIDYSGRAQYLLGKHRRLMGQKPIVQHATLRGDKFGNLFDWREYAPDHVRLLYRMWWEYEILLYLKWGVRPYVDRLWGVPKMFPIVDMLMDLINERGWYAVPGCRAPARVLVSRYGQGLRSAVALGHLGPDTAEGPLTLYGDGLTGHNPIMCGYGGEQFTTTVGGGVSRAHISLGPRRFLVLDALADYEGPDTWRARASADISRHQVVVRITNASGRAVSGTFRFSERVGYAPVAERKATLKAGETLTVNYQSLVYEVSDEAIREFPYLESEIVMPADSDENAKRAADWLSGYFTFWYRFGPPAKPGVRIPIVLDRTGKAYAIDLRLDRPRNVSIRGPSLLFSAPDSCDLAQLIYETLSILDAKYPFHGKFHGGFPLFRDPRAFNYQEKTLQMLREVGLLGGMLDLYEGPELKDLPKRSPAQIKAMYDRIAPQKTDSPKQTPKAKTSTAPNESFESLGTLRCERGYKCVEAKAELDLHEFKDGAASVQVAWRAASDGPGNYRLSKACPVTDVTGKCFEVWLMPLDTNSTGFGIELHDADGKIVEEHRVFHAKPNEWNHILFKQGQKLRYQWLRQRDGDPTRVARVCFRAHTRSKGTTAVMLWDAFRIFEQAR